MAPGETDAYVLGWAEGDMGLIKECAQTILRVSKAILADLTPTPDTADTAEPTDGDTVAD